MPVRKRLRIVRGFHLAFAAVLPGVAGFSFGMFGRDGVGERLLGSSANAVKRFGKDGCWRDFSGFSGGLFHKFIFGWPRFISSAVVKAVYSCAVAFGDQFGFGRKPVLHIATRLGAFVFVGKISAAGDFIGGRCKVAGDLIQTRDCGGVAVGGFPGLSLRGRSLVHISFVG
jgi:hypothetical protein